VKPFFVYLLRCADGSYYVGHSDDLGLRVAQHQQGEIDGYTRTRRPIELAWSQETSTREEALAAELRLKGWSRAKKEALIKGDWALVSKLAHQHGVKADAIPSASSGSQFDRDEALRQAQDERIMGEPEPVINPVRPEPVEGHAGLANETEIKPVRPELVEGHAGLANEAKINPVRPELVEGHVGLANETEIKPVRPELVEGHANALTGILLAGPSSAQRRAIAKSITLLESTRTDHRAQADALLTELLPATGGAFRLGISGVPGVGKSTFIEALGLYLIERGHRVAVLTIDPSSSVSGGSILGDKTRMERLSMDERAYIRPSPSSGNLGGVAEKTREAMLVCEAAGYDIVIVETVGVGQSETAVAGMTDMFVLMQLPNAGDDLQAIKKGVMELADLVVINKADLDAIAAARAQAQIASSLRLYRMHGEHEAQQWQPQVMQLSALKGAGLDAFWAAIKQFRELQNASGGLLAKRRQQSLAWLWERIQAGLRQQFSSSPAVRALLAQTTEQVLQGRLAPSTAARDLLTIFSGDKHA
jgi:LAO/AO transport system kinase